MTDTALRKAKPTDKAQRLFDGGGLYLDVVPSGGKWWRLKYHRRHVISVVVHVVVVQNLDGAAVDRMAV